MEISYQFLKMFMMFTFVIKVLKTTLFIWKFPSIFSMKNKAAVFSLDYQKFT